MIFQNGLYTPLLQTEIQNSNKSNPIITSKIIIHTQSKVKKQSHISIICKYPTTFTVYRKRKEYS